MSKLTNRDHIIGTDTEAQIDGPAGKLELLYRCVEPAQTHTPVAIICHPHPLHGGTLRNKVVHMLAGGFNELGAHSVRFNFRGVAKSAGKFDQGRGESEDLQAVCEWAQKTFPGSPLWLAGFSFGAYVAYRTLGHTEAQRLVLVAPPVTMFEFADTVEPGIPWMVIQGQEDEVISADMVTDWVRQRPHAPAYFLHENTGHFFHGKLNLLKDSLKTGLSGLL
ncbi:MAG: alpha/beta hydrolase [Gammaproteobacteria bacterium]|nr:alpha/beta hydrolase [Gammaproteobacteria bacterium]